MGCFGLVPKRSRMPELDVRIFLRRLDHERIEIAERGGEQQLWAASTLIMDSMLCIIATVSGTLLPEDRDARHRFQCLGADRMGLVPAEVVARTDIDDADGDPAAWARVPAAAPGPTPPAARSSRRLIDARHGLASQFGVVAGDLGETDVELLYTIDNIKHRGCGMMSSCRPVLGLFRFRQ